MNRFSLPLLVVLQAVALCLLPAWAEPLKIEYGANNVDINADGVPDLIVRTRWENGNAHSYDRYLVGIRIMNAYAADYIPAEGVIQEVPLGHERQYEFMTSEGAEILLTAYAFSLNKKGWLEVTRYERPLGESFPDPQPVTITTYRLVDGGAEATTKKDFLLPGDPLFYLKKVKEKKLSRKVSDVRDLMTK